MRCPRCNLAGAYMRMKTKEIVCINCGEITKPEEKEPEHKAETTS